MTADPRIGLIGPFDRETLGDRLAPRVLGHELRQRLPEAQVRTFAPTARYSWWDGGQPAEPLGPCSTQRRQELADQLDCVVVWPDLVDEEGLRADQEDGPDSRCAVPDLTDGLGSDHAVRCPAVWLARDKTSVGLLKEKGVVGTVDTAPDPALLAPRIFSEGLLRKRLEYLRLMGWYPSESRVLVIQGDERLAAAAPIVGAILTRAVEAEPDLAVVVIEVDGWRNDAAFATALEQSLPRGRCRMPRMVSLEDLVTVIRSSTVFLGSSASAHALAIGFDRPRIGLDLVGTAPLEPMNELGETSVPVVHDARTLNDALASAIAGLAPSSSESRLAARRLDSRLDGIAIMAEDSARARARPDGLSDDDRLRRRLSELEAQLATVEAAYDVRGQRLVAERLADADLIWEIRQEKTELEKRFNDAEADLVEVHADWRRSAARLEAELAAKRAEHQASLEAEKLAHADTRSELARLRATRTLRYTAGARRVYGALRRGHP